MDDRIYEPDIPAEDMPRYVYAEFIRVAESLQTLRDEITSLKAQVTGLENP